MLQGVRERPLGWRGLDHVVEAEGERVSSEGGGFKARWRDGVLRVEVWAEVEYDLNDAAAALALTAPAMPTSFGRKSVRRLLRQASRSGTVGEALAQADARMKAAYREKLLELGSFSGPDGSGANRSAQRLANVRVRGGVETARFRPKVFYDIAEAAAALAVVYEYSPVVKLGKETLQRGLRRAAADGLTGTKALAQADPNLAAVYRAHLIEFGIFPKGARSRRRVGGQGE
jgi:hypothetical protein